MADTTKTIGTKVKFDGEAEYKAAVKNINGELKVLGSEMKLVSAEYKANGGSIDSLKAKQETLGKIYDQQKAKVEATEKALAKCKEELGDNSDEAKRLEIQLNNQKTALVNTESELKKTTTELDKTETAADGMGNEVEDSGKQADDASSKFSNFGSIVGNVAKVAAGAVAAIGTAAVVAGKAIYNMASDTASAGDEIDKESQKMQISAGLYQQLSYACERSGSNVSDLTKGIKNITTELGKTSEGAKGAGASFEAIGVSLKNTDGSVKSTEQVLLDSIDALAGMKDETKRNAAAQEIFGKSAAELLPLLNSGADGIKQLMDETEEYGMLMSDDAVAASAAFEDSLSRLQWTFSGVKNSIVGEMLPAITMIIDGLSDLMAGNDGATEEIKD